MKKVLPVVLAVDYQPATWSGRERRTQHLVAGRFDREDLQILGLHCKLINGQVKVDQKTRTVVDKAVERVLGDISDSSDIREQVHNYISAAKSKNDCLVNNSELGRISKILFGDPWYVFNTGDFLKKLHLSFKGKVSSMIPLRYFKNVLCKINSVYLQDKK